MVVLLATSRPASLSDFRNPILVKIYVSRRSVSDVTAIQGIDHVKLQNGLYGVINIPTGGRRLVRILHVLEKPGVRTLRVATEAVQVLTFWGTLLASLGGLAYLGLRQSSLREISSTSLFVATASVVLSVFGLIYYLSRIRDSSEYQIVDLVGTLKVERSTAGHYCYNYRREQTIRARRSGVRLVQIRSHWTGTGSHGGVRSIHSNQLLLDGELPESDGRTYRWIYLRDEIAKGGTPTHVGVTYAFDDRERPMNTYYREGTEGRRATSVRVVLHIDPSCELGAIKVGVWKGSRHGGPKAYVERGDLEPTLLPSGVLEYKIEVEKPDPHHAHGFKWEWSSQDRPARAVAPAPETERDRDQAEPAGAAMRTALDLSSPVPSVTADL